jgi:hypothetical protein
MGGSFINVWIFSTLFFHGDMSTEGTDMHRKSVRPFRVGFGVPVLGGLFGYFSSIPVGKGG